MAWGSLFSSIIDSLAWPAAVVIGLAMLRKPIAQLLKDLRSLKYKDFQFDFGTRLEKVEADVASAPELALAPVPQLAAGTEEHFREIAKLSPLAAIVEAWIPVEKELFRLLEKTQLVAQSAPSAWTSQSPVALIKRLQQAEIIDLRTSTVINDLRRLRNAAAHGQGRETVTYDEAIRYKQMADNVVAALRHVG